MRLTVRIERWPIAGTFTIARGSKTEAVVVVVDIEAGRHRGRGECVPYPRYGETPDGVAAAIEALRPEIEQGALDRQSLQSKLPAGAARNALDCAFWDLEAKRSGRPVWELAGGLPPRPLTTAYTLSLATAEAMGEAARQAAHRPLLKIKLGTCDDAARIAAVRANAPRSRLIVDANEGWRVDTLGLNLAACAKAGVELVEQPLPAADDEALEHVSHLVAICADESVHERKSLPRLKKRYEAVNIKLDKTGGLTEALALAGDAEALGLRIMVGCMVGTSLAMAPAILLAQRAFVVDLDGPLLLAKDRSPGLRYEGSVVHPPTATLWG